MAMNTGYLSTNRGIIKILQIILGFIICSILCANWYGGRSCFGEGRLGFASGLNFVAVIINIVLFVLTLLDLAMYKLERMYSVVMSILFVIATVLLVWYIIEYNAQRGWLIGAAVLIGLEALLHVWDSKILHGEMAN